MRKPFLTKAELFKAKLKGIDVLSVYKDQLPGGVGDDKTPEDFDPESLKEGAEHEMEHTYDPELAQEISIDHLTEDPNYYEKLKKIESSSGSVDLFLSSLYQAVGNKGYMKDLESLFERVLSELSGSESKSLDMLSRDLKGLKSEATMNQSNSMKYWKRGL